VEVEFDDNEGVRSKIKKQRKFAIEKPIYANTNMSSKERKVYDLVLSIFGAVAELILEIGCCLW
jgi:hypothetical protein